LRTVNFAPAADGWSAALLAGCRATKVDANGLYSRATVFTGLGIRQTTYYVSSGGGGAVGASLSTDYLRAMKTGNTIGQLVQKEGRDSVQQRVIDKAQKDPVFARDVAMRTRQTLQDFLGVKIPEVVSISVIVETPRTFAIVVPHKPAADESADDD
jgi:hypothetical protein